MTTSRWSTGSCNKVSRHQVAYWQIYGAVLLSKCMSVGREYGANTWKSIYGVGSSRSVWRCLDYRCLLTIFKWVGHSSYALVIVETCRQICNGYCLVNTHSVMLLISPIGFASSHLENVASSVRVGGRVWKQLSRHQLIGCFVHCLSHSSVAVFASSLLLHNSLFGILLAAPWRTMAL